MGLARLAIIVCVGVGGMVRGAPDHEGYTVRYGRGDVMSRVAHNRGIPWHPHMAAYTFARDEDMGRLWLHIRGPAGEVDFLVVDLPQPGKDRQNLIRREVITEVDYWSGFLLCGRGWTGRAQDCPVEVWRLNHAHSP